MSTALVVDHRWPTAGVLPGSGVECARRLVDLIRVLVRPYPVPHLSDLALAVDQDPRADHGLDLASP